MKYLLIILLLLVPSSAYAFTYENTDLNIRMEIPDDWVYREFNENALSFLPIYLAEFAPSSLVEINNSTENIDSPVSLQLFKDIDPPYQNMPLELYKEHLIKIYDFNTTAFEKVNIGKENDIVAYNTQALSNSTLYHTILVFMVKDDPYRLLFMTNRDKFDEYYPIFQNITKSIEFLN